MEQGTLGELVLTRSVIKHIRKHNKDVLIGSGVGKDFSLIKATGDYIVNAEAVANSPYIAWVKALNNLWVSGGNPEVVRVNYLLPSSIEEQSLKEYAARFNSLADDSGIQIAGGHSQVSNAYNEPTFLVEAIGSIMEDKLLIEKPKADWDVVMAGYVGVLGTNLIINNKMKELRERYAESYIKGGMFSEEEYSVAGMTQIVTNCKDEAGVAYMHDVSFGGVYGALWQLGEATKLGVRVEHRSIPIRQETVEICNYFDINPYMLEGTGALLVVAKDGEKVANTLNQSGIKASVVGKLTQNKDRIVVLNSEGEKRFLAPVKGDEIYKVIAAY